MFSFIEPLGLLLDQQYTGLKMEGGGEGAAWQHCHTTSSLPCTSFSYPEREPGPVCLLVWDHKLCILLVDILLTAAPPPLLTCGKVLLVGQLEQELSLQLEQPPGVDLVDGRLQQVVVQPLTLVHCSAVGIENRLHTNDDHLSIKDHKMFSPLIHEVY